LRAGRVGPLCAKLLQIGNGALSHCGMNAVSPFQTMVCAFGRSLDSLGAQNYVAGDLRGLAQGSLARALKEGTLREKPGDTDPETGRNGLDRPPPGEDELARRMRSLDERLDRRQEERKPAESGKPGNAGMAAALRLSTDFVAAVLVGAAIGFGLDRFFGIAPWGMIAFLLLGFCAGVLNVLRSAGRIADPHARGLPPAATRSVDDDEDEDK
jgi:ATP synthase protein I